MSDGFCIPLKFTDPLKSGDTVRVEYHRIEKTFRVSVIREGDGGDV